MLEERLLSMHAALDARTGFTDTQPLRAADPVPLPISG